MDYKFSDRVQGLKPSAIREIFKYSSDSAYIPLSAGNPMPEAFPSEAIEKISRDLLLNTPVAALQYGTTEGYQPLRELLTDYMREKHKVGSEQDSLIITSGAQQVMDLFTKSLINPGDVIFCEEPSFIGSLNTFRSFEARLVGIAMEDDGVDIQALEQALKAEPRGKYFYTIPNFQNPSGITMSLEKRRSVYELCKKHGVMILEDNPYGELRYRGEDIPCIKSFDTDGIVMYAGTFSKVIAPGMRVGYAIGPSAVIQKMVVCKQGEDVHTNIWAQIVCQKFMEEFDYEAHLQSLRVMYRDRADYILKLLETYFKPKGISWSSFDGGLFAWCKLPKGVEMMDFCNRALKQQVCVVPGTAFLSNVEGNSDSFRINFSTPTRQQLDKGIEILSQLI